MKPILFTALLTLALSIGACRRNPPTTATADTAKAETVSPLARIETDEVAPEKAEETADDDGPDFGGLPHDVSCTVDHYGIGRGLIEGGQLAGGIVELEKGVFDEPENAAMRRALGDAYHQKGDLDRAAGHLEIAVDLLDDPATWQDLAQLYFERKDFAQAQHAIVRLTKLDPGSPQPWLLLTRIYQSKNMWRESIDSSEEAIARGADSPWAFNNLGYAYLVLGRSDDAIRELEKAVSFDSGVTAAIWNNLGLAYEKKGELADAASAYRSALAGNPQYGNARVNLGRLTERAGEQGIAIGTRDAKVEIINPPSTPAPVPSPTALPEVPWEDDLR